jgi:WD40 repeat protein
MIARIPAQRAVGGVGFTKDQSTLFVRSETQIDFYDVNNGRCIATAGCSSHANAVEVHPTAPFIAVANDEELTILDADSKRPLKRLLVGGPRMLERQMLREMQHWMKLAPSPKVKWQLDELTKAVNRGPRPYIDPEPDRTRGSERVTDLQFSRDGRLLGCTTNVGARIYAWDALMAEPLSTPAPIAAADAEPVRFDHGGSPSIHACTYACCFDDDRGQLLFCGMEGSIRSLDVASGDVRTVVDVPGRPVLWRMRLSRGGDTLCCSFKKEFFERSPKEPSVIQFWDYRALCQRPART